MTTRTTKSRWGSMRGSCQMSGKTNSTTPRILKVLDSNRGSHSIKHRQLVIVHSLWRQLERIIWGSYRGVQACQVCKIKLAREKTQPMRKKCEVEIICKTTMPCWARRLVTQILQTLSVLRQRMRMTFWRLMIWMRVKILSLTKSKGYSHSSITRFWNVKNKTKLVSKTASHTRLRITKGKLVNSKARHTPIISSCRRSLCFRAQTNNSLSSVGTSNILLRQMARVVLSIKIYKLELLGWSSTLKANLARKIQVMVKKWQKQKWQRNSFSICNNSSNNKSIPSQYRRVAKQLLRSLWGTWYHLGRKRRGMLYQRSKELWRLLMVSKGSLK